MLNLAFLLGTVVVAAWEFTSKEPLLDYRLWTRLLLLSIIVTRLLIAANDLWPE